MAIDITEPVPLLQGVDVIGCIIYANYNSVSPFTTPWVRAGHQTQKLALERFLLLLDVFAVKR